MLVFGIDTSSTFISMGLVKDKNILGEISFPFSRESLGKWIPWLDFLLKECASEVEQIDAFACVSGPGAFTNLRLGLSSIKGLAFALKKPVASFSSLEIYAQRVPFPQIRVLIPSCKGSFFYSVYENHQQVFLPRFGSIEEILDDSSQKEIWVGPNQAEFLSLCVPANIQTIALPPTGSFVAAHALTNILSGKTIDAVSLQPEYWRVSRAQEKI
ncbi:MAG: tRNA (adenosine(37)-N6)-threonylcarbamoyltransferase complex dimerization subunit type 1 TsaB [Candidatus Brocadiae bacterium]|nr:tRNA (adenosine(37)-N6)-threonylcarbamoyltransferase complex dimerization subunit type 1 TsaB [Candidatus Brocadiia bacterium]